MFGYIGEPMKRTCNLPALFLVTALLLLKPAFAQDRVYVFFESGSAKLDDAQLKVLDRIRVKYNVSETDSIRITGFADSLGNQKANLKLSEKRARAVAKYCERLVPDKTPIIISGRGEKDKNIESRDRRVEITFFFHSESIPDEPRKKDTIIVPPKPVCYYVDYIMLSQAHTRVITKGRKEYVLVEIPEMWFERNDDHFATDDEKGNMVLKRIKWVKRAMNGFRSRSSYQVQIPKKDFDKYGIVIPQDTPCRSCATRFTDDGPVVRPDTCFWPDNFLMEHTQFRLPVSKRTHVILRAPKEYININETYYLEHRMDSPLTWETKRGKQNERYYFTNVPIHQAELSDNYYARSISRKFPCCFDSTFAERRTDSGFVVDCATVPPHGRPYFLQVEAGDHYDNGLHHVYAGIGYCRYFYGQGIQKHYINIVAGVDHKPGFYAAARYQNNLVMLSLRSLIPYMAWQQPGYPSHTKHFAVYLGVALETNHTRSGRTRLEQQMHAGIALLSGNTQNRLFVQYGPAFDYLSSGNLYSVLQFGVGIKVR